jgi:uncharacterized protein (DUF1810 family)
VLGARLRECTRIVNAIEGSTLEAIFGYPDHLKFCSSMTMFARAAPDEALFGEALRKYCAAREDPMTLERLGR